MKLVKLTTKWNHDYYSQTFKNSGIFENFHFEINNDIDYCDWWVIWGDLRVEETVRVNPDNIIYITDEVHQLRQFNIQFLKQFKSIASVRKDLGLDNVIEIFEICPWYFNKKYDDIVNQKPKKKSKTISVVSSDLTLLHGHKKRYAFVNKLIGHFKDKIDVYGRGFNEIPDKWDALIDYKYSIAIENNQVESYFTEKISECYLTYTIPVYFGCPNISDFYKPESFINIDIDNYMSAFRAIEELIDSDNYERLLPHIIEAREMFLKKYHMFPAIVNLIKANTILKSKRSFQKVTLYPEAHFINKAESIKFKTACKLLLKSVIKNF